MGKDLMRSDRAQGLIDEGKSQVTGLLVGIATVAVVVPYLGWIVGGIAAVAAVGVTTVRSYRKKNR